MLRREFAYGEYRLTLIALIVGVTTVTALSLTTSRIQNAMLGQAVDLIGGDVVVQSSTQIKPETRSLAASFELKQSLSVTSLTMASVEDNFLLSSIRAVDDQYPLKGMLTTRRGLEATPVESAERPASGEAWVERGVLERLNSTIGTTIDIGHGQFKITRVLDIEPDRGGSFYSINPRILLNWADLDKTAVVQPGSRLQYKLMLSGDEAQVSGFTKAVEPTLDASQRLISPQNKEDQLSENLGRAKGFINISTLLAVILCGIAVSLAASHHARRHIKQVALLRCFGLKPSDVNVIHILQLIFISIPAIALGLGLGYLTHSVLMQFIAELFRAQLPAASLSAWLSGPITALFMVLGFGLPPLLRLAKISPARVFRQDTGNPKNASLFSITVALLALSLISWWQTGDLKLALIGIAGLIVIILVLSVLVVGLLKLLAKYTHQLSTLRGAISNIMAKPSLTAMQVVGFGISLFAIALIVFFRTDVMDQWNQQIPHNAPNRFVFDLSPANKSAFSTLLNQHDVDTQIYPVVRGRLININGKRVQTAVSKERDGALNRDLSLTQVEAVPYENEIIEGEFISTYDPALKLIPVSVESQVAEVLGLHLNDTLEFLIEGQTLLSTVASIRTVNWENFRPNFYMLFPNGALDQFSQSNLTSFYLPPENTTLEKKIHQNFIGTTVVNVDFIISRIQRLIEQISAAMELTFSMAVLAGLTVFWAALLTTAHDKQTQAALLRALGASRKSVRRRFIAEQLVIGFLGGFLASICLLLVSYLISTEVLTLPWQAPWLIIVLLPLGLMAVLSIFASIQLHGIMNKPPFEVLRQKT